MQRFLLLFLAPVLAFATESGSWNWPTDGFHVALYVGGDIMPGTTVTQGRPLLLMPILAQFDEGKNSTYDLRYSIVIAREGEAVFRELNRHLTGVRDSSTSRKCGGIGPVLRWDGPTTVAPGIYRATIIAHDMLGAKSMHRSYDVTIKKRG